MSNELDIRRESALQSMIDVDCHPVLPELNLDMSDASKIELGSLAALGIAFQPLATAIQTAINGPGGSGLYYVNTGGKQMFETVGGYIGSLKNASGGVGGGQARMTALACDPTLLFMAAALMSVEQKLDAIKETQAEILEFLEAKEREVLQGNLNVLTDVMSNFKFNWDNAAYKASKLILVQQVKKDAETSIIHYRDQIAKTIKKRTSLHSNHDVKSLLTKLQPHFKDYQLALYLHAYSTFLEVLLLGNFSEGYLNNIERILSEYSFEYRSLYTECYSIMEKYSKSSIQAGMLGGLATASKFMGETIAKVPIISKSQLDENLIDVGGKLERHGATRSADALGVLFDVHMSATTPFIENIRTINELNNTPVIYLFDRDNIYVKKIAG